MNPKEQSRLDLMLRFRDVDVPRAAFWDNPTVAEINRRLVEADALRKENEELRNLFGECPKRNNRLGTYSDAKPVQIDVCKLICITKESEASHE